MQERLYQIALVMTPGIGNILARKLISYCGSAQQLFCMPKGRLMRIPHIGEKLATALLFNQAQSLEKAQQQLELAEQHKARLIFFTDPDYPERLKPLYDAPALLYYKGSASLNHAKIVALVGTRQATDYGKGITRELIAEIKKYQPLIVSGLAYGIDIEAHRAALNHELPTLAVMGTGLDSIYPFLHQRTAIQMLAQGGLLSEYPFGSKADAVHFPERNRIIAGLADLLIVVESALRGGAMLTAEIANSYNREVFAVPGDLHSRFSEGCNHLIKVHKANILTSVADIEYMMNWNCEGSKSPKVLPKDLAQDEQTLCQLLSHTPEMQIDELAWQSQLSMNKVAALLLGLEFRGLVKVLPGKKYRLNA